MVNWPKWLRLGFLFAQLTYPSKFFFFFIIYWIILINLKTIEIIFVPLKSTKFLPAHYSLFLFFSFCAFHPHFPHFSSIFLNTEKCPKHRKLFFDFGSTKYPLFCFYFFQFFFLFFGALFQISWIFVITMKGRFKLEKMGIG